MRDRMQTLELWKSCQVRAANLSQFASVAKILMGFRPLYEKVQAESGVPWYVVGALDCREEDFSHRGYLGNGDPLNRPTTHVPRGRGPFATWDQGAADVFTMLHFGQLPAGSHWDIVTALIKMEEYNGTGYEKHGLPSPYVWAGTNIQKPGKYTADGHWDAEHYDTQPGTAGILLTLKKYHGVDLQEG